MSAKDGRVLYAVQDEWTFLLAARREDNRVSDFVFARFLLETAELDDTFGTGGVLISNPFYGDERLFDVEVAPDGKILTVGECETYALCIARYGSEGR